MGIYGIENDLVYQGAQGRENVKQRQAQSAGGIKEEAGMMIAGATQDEYISGDGSQAKASGLYKIGRDENGKPKILYDDPKKMNEKSVKEDEAKKPRQADKPEDKPEKCVSDTDKVDREIEKLKKEKAQLEQQIKASAGDEDKIKGLKQKLAQIQSELNQKDNDAYRRQNSSFVNL